MLSPPSSSPYSRRGNRPSRPNTPSKSPGEGYPELSDVPCYTCRRRHVKCDRILPHCAKCAKKGVPCLGYRKPLRWAEGVAVRGKFKGKSQPIIDNQALSLARDIVHQDSSSANEEAAYLGLHAAHSDRVDAVTDNAAFLDLIDYHNAVLCAPHPGSELSQNVVRKIAPLSPEAVQRLPREILLCILGISSVHRAIRNQGNNSIEQVALETKVGLFQSISRLFQEPENHRADVLFSCIGLMFSMDVMENGVGRWSVHFAGALNLLASSGGAENFAFHYPHLKLILARTLHFETMQILLFPVSIDEPKQAGRQELQTLCCDPHVRDGLFITCPQRLFLAVYDLGECAQNIFRAHESLSMADVYKREWILSDVLLFQPAEGTRDVKEFYYAHRDLTMQEEDGWNIVFTSWRSAIIIVVLRHLYFGLPDPELPLQMSRSPTPSLCEPGASQLGSYDPQFDSYLNVSSPDTGYELEQSTESFLEAGHLQPEHFMTDPISRTPSPLHSIPGSTDSITLDFWNRRYDLHNEAFSELSSSLTALLENPDPSLIRYALVPIMILALISRPDSSERALCLKCFDMFESYTSNMSMSEVPEGATSPIGGTSLDFDIPWDRLDAYSEEVDRERLQNVIFTDSQLVGSAPEWNWWYMLKNLQLKTLWPINAGTMHMELGTEFLSFSVLSSLVNEECLAAFMQSPSSSSSS